MSSKDNIDFEKFNELLDINKESKNLSPVDNIVVNIGDSWVLQPLIFDKADYKRTPILSIINTEMIGDSNAEILSGDNFFNPTLDDKMHYDLLLNTMKSSQVEVLARSIFNYIIETSVISFTNYCNTLFDDILHIDYTTAAYNFKLKMDEDEWILKVLTNYIYDFIKIDKKYNIIKDMINKANDHNEFLPDGTWRDYTTQIAVTIAQYIGTLMTRSLFENIYFVVYVDNNENLKKLIESSVLIKANNKEKFLNEKHFIYTYICTFISNSLYNLVASSINQSVYRALCNVPCTFISVFETIRKSNQNRED